MPGILTKVQELPENPSAEDHCRIGDETDQFLQLYKLEASIAASTSSIDPDTVSFTAAESHTYCHRAAGLYWTYEIGPDNNYLFDHVWATFYPRLLQNLQHLPHPVRLIPAWFSDSPKTPQQVVTFHRKLVSRVEARLQAPGEGYANPYHANIQLRHEDFKILPIFKEVIVVVDQPLAFERRLRKTVPPDDQILLVVADEERAHRFNKMGDDVTLERLGSEIWTQRMGLTRAIEMIVAMQNEDDETWGQLPGAQGVLQPQPIRPPAANEGIGET